MKKIIKNINKRESTSLIWELYLTVFQEDIDDYLAGYEMSESLQTVVELDERLTCGKGWKALLRSVDEPVVLERKAEWFEAQDLKTKKIYALQNGNERIKDMYQCAQ